MNREVRVFIMETLEKTRKMQSDVQLLRIVACLIVIICHIRVYPVNDGMIDKGNLLLFSFFNDGVSIFFCIMGFFLFKKSFGNNLKRMLKDILVPTLFIIIISNLYYCFMENLKITFDFYEFIRKTLSFDFSGTDLTYHLWWISSYIKIILLFPILKAITENRNTIIYVIFYSMFVLFIKDIQHLIPLSQGEISTFFFFDISVIYVLLGFVLYQYKDKIIRIKYIKLYSIVVAVISKILCYYAQLFLLTKDITNDYFYYWSTILSAVFTGAIIVLFLSLDIKNTIVNYIGSLTFYIYLIHVLIIDIIRRMGIENRFRLIYMNNNKIIMILLYDMLYGLFIFTISAIFAFVIKWILDVISKIFKNRGVKNVGTSKE